MNTREDFGKLEYDLLPVEALEEAIRVLMFGANKYEKDGWRTKPYMPRERITNSLKRHQAAIEKGELVDEESGLYHSAHIVVNALFQLESDIQGYFLEIEDTLAEETREEWEIDAAEDMGEMTEQEEDDYLQMLQDEQADEEREEGGEC